MSKPVITFTNFNFCYHNLAEQSLHNINLEIYSGEKILITGRSGSGKSTLLHCINGIIPHSTYGEISGTLEISGIESTKNGIFEISQEVGTILQDQDSQFIGLSVGEDVAFSLENYAIPHHEMQDIVKNSLTQVNMLEYIEHSPYELSGGQKQSVSLAGILASAPNILLFDEPLANLDPKSVTTITSLIKQLNHDTKKTIIIAEHRIEECLEIGIDRIIVMDKGQIVKVGTPHEILYSGIFEELGIRMPFYIEAMKYAGSYEDLHPINCYLDMERLPQKSEQNLLSWINSLPKVTETIVNSNQQVLHLKNLFFGYNKNNDILQNINLSINKGEIISILGNNGAGKSTLTQIISGFHKQNKGDIFLDKVNINNLSIKERGKDIANIMQNPNSMIIKTIVWDEVALGLQNQNFDKSTIAQLVEKALRTCGLWGYRNWPISALSYGQKKRVTIASMLVLEPKILILDEPTAGQDLKTYHEFMEFIAHLATTGIAIIIITHDIYLAVEYTTRSIIINNGEIIADDSPYEVFSNYAILSKASLKEISLSTIARKLNIDSATFIQKFIYYKHSQQL